MSPPTPFPAPASTRGAIAEKPWHAHITIDLLAHVLARSIFHPFIAWLIPLCLRSLSYPTSHPHFQYTCFYAALVSLLALLGKLNNRLAWGPTRKLDWEREVVVITGGASGLGKVIAEMYGMRGVSVAVLDVRVPEEKERSEALEHVRFYKCDVASLEDVRRARGEIEEDVRRADLSRYSVTKRILQSRSNPQLLSFSHLVSASKKPNHRSNQPSDYSTTANHPSTARLRHHPNKQRRHRRRPPSPLAPPRANHQNPNDKPPLALPHPPNFPPVPPRSTFRRHNRHNLLCAWKIRSGEFNGLCGG